MYYEITAKIKLSCSKEAAEQLKKAIDWYTLNLSEDAECSGLIEEYDHEEPEIKEISIDGYIGEVDDIESSKKTECRNCGEMVEMIPTGEFCPSCFC